MGLLIVWFEAVKAKESWILEGSRKECSRTESFGYCVSRRESEKKPGGKS